MPIAPPGPQTSGAPSAPVPQQSFRERAVARLGQESAPERPQPTERQNPTPPARTPSRDVGSAQDLEQDPQGFQADDEYEEEGQGGLYEDPDDGTPSDSTPGENPQEGGDWEKRYQDTKAELTRLSQERGEMSQEHAETMGEVLRLKFDLEDRFEEAVGRAEYFANVMSGHANQFRNINWTQVPPDQVANLQQRAQQALAMEQQATAAWDEVKRRKDDALTHVKQREAAIAKTRLKRTIGLNNEVYSALRQFTVSRGMDPQRFNELTDPVIMEALFTQMQVTGAGNKVLTKNKRKAQAPGGRQPQQQPRDSRGKYERAQVVPNQRGSFAEKTRHRLATERQGR